MQQRPGEWRQADGEGGDNVTKEAAVKKEKSSLSLSLSGSCSSSCFNSCSALFLLAPVSRVSSLVAKAAFPPPVLV